MSNGHKFTKQSNFWESAFRPKIFKSWVILSLGEVLISNAKSQSPKPARERHTADKLATKTKHTHYVFSWSPSQSQQPAERLPSVLCLCTLLLRAHARTHTRARAPCYTPHSSPHLINYIFQMTDFFIPFCVLFDLMPRLLITCMIPNETPRHASPLITPGMHSCKQMTLNKRDNKIGNFLYIYKYWTKTQHLHIVDITCT